MQKEVSHFSFQKIQKRVLEGEAAMELLEGGCGWPWGLLRSGHSSGRVTGRSLQTQQRLSSPPSCWNSAPCLPRRVLEKPKSGGSRPSEADGHRALDVDCVITVSYAQSRLRFLLSSFKKKSLSQNCSGLALVPQTIVNVYRKLFPCLDCLCDAHILWNIRWGHPSVNRFLVRQWKQFPR